MRKLNKKEKDIILAGAIGDAIGYKVEFTKLKYIFELYGGAGLRIQDIPPSERLIVSDDTQMTLFALEGLLKKDSRIKKWYLDWYRTQFFSNDISDTNGLISFKSMHKCQAPGTTCVSALGKLYRKESICNNDSKGCGAVMRAAPFGFIQNMELREIILCGGEEQGIITHHHPSGYLPAGIMAGLIHLAVHHNYTNIEDALTVVMNELRKLYKDEVTNEIVGIINLVKFVISRDESNSYNDIATIGLGWTGEEALAIALYCVMSSSSFEECINKSINHDGDSDSTGSIASQLWVAYNSLPEKYRSWQSRLDIRDAYEYVIELGN